MAAFAKEEPGLGESQHKAGIVQTDFERLQSQDTCGKEQPIEHTTQAQQDGPGTADHYYPEGGFGWCVLAGTFVVGFWCLGLSLSWGVFLQYFLHTKTFTTDNTNSHEEELAWAGSIGSACIFAGAPIAAVASHRLGIRPILVFGVLASSLGLITASFANRVWHLYLTMGILSGFGGSTLYFTSLMILSQYFHRRRGIVAGIAASGAGVGASALAPLTRYMLAALGFPWTARILGGCLAVCLSLAVCCLRPYRGSNSSTAMSSSSSTIRNADAVESEETPPPRTTPGPSPSPITSGGLDFRLLRRPSFALILVATNLATLVYLVPLFLISNYITTIVGGTAAQGAAVVSICSAVAILARVLFGTIADRLGVLNIAATCCLLSGVSALCLWGGHVAPATMPVTTAFMVCYGIFAGSAIVLLPVAATKAVGPDKLASAVGFVFFSHTIGYLLGTPIAQAVIRAQGGGVQCGVGAGEGVCQSKSVGGDLKEKGKRSDVTYRYHCI
ncbi:MAG: major facilitator superfamily domain-containing protein [Podila humilis]|nr:MAG: major facilitator superfamily domain-containing protein [Podila humilis]